MKDRDTIFFRAIFVLLIIILVAIVALFTSGCKVLKSKQTKEVDSSYTKIASDIAASLKKETVSSQSDWWRQTYQYPPVTVSGDTTINNYYQYPTRVIVEGGRNNTDAVIETKDTSSKQSNESKQVSAEEMSKDKESKPMNLWWLLIIWGGWEVVKMVWGYFKGKISITYKK